MFCDSQWTVSTNNQKEYSEEYQSHSLHEKDYFFLQFQGENPK